MSVIKIGAVYLEQIRSIQSPALKVQRERRIIGVLVKSLLRNRRKDLLLSIQNKDHSFMDNPVLPRL
jgi:hypothetical protein